VHIDDYVRFALDVALGLGERYVLVDWEVYADRQFVADFCDDFFVESEEVFAVFGLEVHWG
jgi:hypothetical protein